LRRHKRGASSSREAQQGRPTRQKPPHPGFRSHDCSIVTFVTIAFRLCHSERGRSDQLKERAIVSDDVISEIKAHARVLHRRAQAGEASALELLRALPELAQRNHEEIGAELQRRHCLAAVARQLGFRSWKHAKDVLSDVEQRDFGTLLYPSSCSGHYNIWSASYDEAKEIRAAHGGFLLVYRHQFLVVDEAYIDSMGLDPADPDWARIGRDWARPGDLAARARLYRRAVHNALASSA
jgi:hypothetical protein